MEYKLYSFDGRIFRLSLIGGLTWELCEREWILVKEPPNA